MRRGKPCTYLKYGVDYAVNAGTFMYFAPMDQASRYVKDPKKEIELWRIYGQELTNLHLG